MNTSTFFTNIYTAAKAVQNIALTGSVRLPALIANIAGVAMVGEVALRGCELVGGKATKFVPFKFLRSRVKRLAAKLKTYKLYKMARYFEPYRTRELLAYSAALIIGSNVVLWAVDKVVKPHWLYNEVLSHISYFHIDLEANPLEKIGESFSNLGCYLSSCGARAIPQGASD